jgi:hypothetical protein
MLYGPFSVPMCDMIPKSARIEPGRGISDIYFG